MGDVEAVDGPSHANPGGGGIVVGVEETKGQEAKGVEVALNPPPPPSVCDVDSDLIAKCLAKNTDFGRNLVVSLYDYGGQQAFDQLHDLLLTPVGVYIVVFNMLDLADQSRPGERCQSLGVGGFVGWRGRWCWRVEIGFSTKTPHFSHHNSRSQNPTRM